MFSAFEVCFKTRHPPKGGRFINFRSNQRLTMPEKTVWSLNYLSKEEI